MSIPSNIEELAHKVRTEIYGRDVREALATSMEATAEVAEWSRQVAQQIIDGEFDEAELSTEIERKLNELEQEYAPELTNIKNEVEDARGNESTLGNRLDGFSSQLAQTAKQSDLINVENKLSDKVDKTEFTSALSQKVDKNVSNQITMEMLTQSVREAMTGGSVAVVGTRSVGLAQFTSEIQRDISHEIEQSLTIMDDTHYRIEDGKAVENTSVELYYSAILDVVSGEYLMISTRTQSANQHGIIYVDDEFNVIESDLQGKGTSTIYQDYLSIVPDGATQVILCVYSNKDLLKASKLEYSPIATKEYVNNVITDQTNHWNGKKVIFQGDSITDQNYNSGLSVTYPTYVAEKLGLNIVGNYAISGSTIAEKESNPTDRNPIVNRYQEMDDDADLVIVAAGTNDWYYTHTPLGDMDSRSNNTFYGALHNLCLGLKKKYKNKTILFMLPIMRRQGNYQNQESTNGNGKTLKEYGNIIKEVCDYYSIPVLDMYTESGLYPFDDDLAVEYYIQQGSDPDYYYTHPNSKGHRMMGKRLLGYLKQLA